MKSKTNSDPSGFIKLDRKILDWEWWDDLNTFRLFMTILLMANWEDKKWRGRTIKRGQLWTSISALSLKSGLSIQQTRNSLDKLKSTGELTDISTSAGRLVTVVKYDVYQSVRKKPTNKPTNETAEKQQTSNKRTNKRATTTKEHKELKEVIKEQQEQQEDGLGCPTTAIDFNELLSVEEIKKLSTKYQDVDSLIRTVEEDVNAYGRKVSNPYRYICGVARNVGWPVR